MNIFIPNGLQVAQANSLFSMLDASNINLFLNQTSKNMKKKILGQ